MLWSNRHWMPPNDVVLLSWQIATSNPVKRNRPLVGPKTSTHRMFVPPRPLLLRSRTAPLSTEDKRRCEKIVYHMTIENELMKSSSYFTLVFVFSSFIGYWLLENVPESLNQQGVRVGRCESFGTIHCDARGSAQNDAQPDAPEKNKSHVGGKDHSSRTTDR